MHFFYSSFMICFVECRVIETEPFRRDIDEEEWEWKTKEEKEEKQ